MGCIVGPDGRGGEALYFNLNQTGGKLFLVQVDPETGQARQFNAPQGPGAWAFITGPDDRIYLGTWDGGLILRFDPKQPDQVFKSLVTCRERELPVAVRHWEGWQALRLHLSRGETGEL